MLKKLITFEKPHIFIYKKEIKNMNYSFDDIMEMRKHCGGQENTVVNIGKIPYYLKGNEDECLSIWFDELFDDWVSVWKLPEDKKIKKNKKNKR